MGADIHLVTQVRQPDGTWRDVEPDYRCPACQGTGKYGTSPACAWCGGSGKGGQYDWRDYRIFALLADVRNGDGVEPLAAPRGLPADFDVDDARGPNHLEHGGMWMGDHSHSWLTVAELSAHQDWPEDAMFAQDFLPAIAKLGEPDAVRIVFGFDN